VLEYVVHLVLFVLLEVLDEGADGLFCVPPLEGAGDLSVEGVGEEEDVGEVVDAVDELGVLEDVVEEGVLFADEQFEGDDDLVVLDDPVWEFEEFAELEGLFVDPVLGEVDVVGELHAALQLEALLGQPELLLASDLLDEPLEQHLEGVAGEPVLSSEGSGGLELFGDEPVSERVHDVFEQVPVGSADGPLGDGVLDVADQVPGPVLRFDDVLVVPGAEVEGGLEDEGMHPVHPAVDLVVQA